MSDQTTQTTEDLDPGAYIGREPERVPRRESDGEMTLPGASDQHESPGESPGDSSADGDRIHVVEGEVGSASFKEPKDIEPVENGLSDQGALAGVDGAPVDHSA